MVDLLTAREIARALDMHPSGRGWRGWCPICGYAEAALLSPKGRLHCVVCGKDHALDAAVVRLRGGEPLARSVAPAKPPTGADDARRVRALGIWRGGSLIAGTPAEHYLAARRVQHIAASEALRFRADTPHPNGGRLPAMLALIVDAAGGPLALHRTYLRSDGSSKADVDPPKASLAPVWRGAIRLDPIATEVVVAEGIESAASAGLLLGLPACAAVSAGNLARAMELPPEVRRVVIAADHDAPNRWGRRPGQEAAEAAARRWRAEGRQVRIAMPRGVGSDFNDVLLRGESDAA